MDTAVVAAAGQQLKAVGERLSLLLSEVDHTARLAIHAWDGGDAEQFWATWQHHLQPQLADAAAAITGLGQSALNNVREQEVASGDLGSGGAAVTDMRRMPAPASLTPSAMVQFAKSSYTSGSTNLPLGWRDLTDVELRKMGIDPVNLHNSNGLDARIMTDGNGKYVIAYAGTHEGSDWQDNAGSYASARGVANRSWQVEDAVDLAVQVKASVGAENLMLTGHSLGGREAAAAAVATGSEAVTFNAAGVTDEDLVYAQTVAGDGPSLFEYVGSKFADTLRNDVPVGLVTNYVTDTDILTGAQVLTDARDAIGTQITVSSDAINPVSDHALDNFDGRI